MKESQLIKPKLKRLRLPGLAEALEERLREATERKWSYREFLDFLLSDEIDKRENKIMTKRIGRSGLDPEKTMETFDFSFNKDIDELLIRELATNNYIEKGENIFILGLSGVGKSHLAHGLGHEACRGRYEVFYYRQTDLLKKIHGGRGDGTREKRLEEITKSSLLIIDDFGLQPLTKEQQDDLYEIICQRSEKRSTILTSNRDVGEWVQIFDNPLIGSAAVDRLVYRAISLVIRGESYRMAEYKKMNKLKEEKRNK